MSENKRAEPFWQLPGVVKQFDSGAEIREESIGADHVLIHVTVPDTIETERLASFARNFSKELPKNARAIFTHEDIQIKVHRPRSVSLSMVGNKIEGDVLLRELKQLLDDSNITNIQLHIQDNIIEQAQPIVQPSVLELIKSEELKSEPVGVPTEEAKGNNGHGESGTTGQPKGQRDRRSPQKKGGGRKVKST